MKKNHSRHKEEHMEKKYQKHHSMKEDVKTALKAKIAEHKHHKEK